MEKVNTKGSGAALGHPLRAKVARQVSSLLTELERLGSDLGVISMCIGTDMGIGSLIVRE